MWMGAVGIGPVAQLDIGIGGTIGTAVAITTGTGAETAILFGVPVAVIMQFLNTLLMSAYSGVMLSADRRTGFQRNPLVSLFLWYLYIFSLHNSDIYRYVLRK